MVCCKLYDVAVRADRSFSCITLAREYTSYGTFRSERYFVTFAMRCSSNGRAVCVNGVLCGEKGKERRKKGEKELGQTNTDIHTNISTHTYT